MNLDWLPPPDEPPALPQPSRLQRFVKTMVFTMVGIVFVILVWILQTR